MTMQHRRGPGAGDPAANAGAGRGRGGGGGGAASACERGRQLCPAKLDFVAPHPPRAHAQLPFAPRAPVPGKLARNPWQPAAR